ncbi:MAG: hypothetical protein NNA30_04200 [Nitrospira sp.]|nr:hypothetical protein [Nitrospira sp.]
MIELFRHVGAAQVVNDQVRLKQRQRGVTPAQLVETLIALWTAGRDRSHSNAGLPGGFHIESLRCGAPARRRPSPEESAPLAGVGVANRRIVAAVQHQAPQRTATLDVDATILDPRKHTVTITYDGTRGYQPVIVAWAEQDLIVHNKFRDGHVPAGFGNMRIREQAVANRPAGITQLFVRGDSTLYEQEVLARGETPARGIEYAIGEDMSPPLWAEIGRLPEHAWQPDHDEADVICEWAEVPSVPDDGHHRKNRPCVRRYLAIRVRKQQGEPFADGSTVTPPGFGLMCCPAICSAR